MTQPAPNLQGVVRDGRVQMTDEIGQLSEVPVGELSAALAKGLRPASPEQVQAADISAERGTLGQQALTFGEAGLSTITLGASDYLGSKLSPEWRDATRERRAENPNVTLAGEIAGAVIPALASGGSSAAAQGVRAAATPMRALGALGGMVEGGIAAGARAAGWSGSGLASRAALRGLQMAGSGALEGGAFEVTRGLVDAVLNDKEYTAETLAANLERGIKWGVIGGAAVGPGSVLTGAAGKKALDSILQGRTLQQAARDLAENHAVKSVVGDLKNLAGREAQIGRKILDAGIPLDAPGLAKAAVKMKVASAADEVLAAAKRLDELGVRMTPEILDDLKSVGLKELSIPAQQLAPPRISTADLAALKAKTDDLFAHLTPEEQLAVRNTPHGRIKETPEFLSAMRKMQIESPTQWGTLYRGTELTPAEIQAVLTERGFTVDRATRTSLDPELAKIYPIRTSPGKQRVILEIKSADSASSLVSDTLSMDNFEEMLLPAGTKFEVLGHELLGDTHHIRLSARTDGRIADQLTWQKVANARSKADDLTAEKLDDVLAKAQSSIDDDLVARAAQGDTAAVQQLQARKGAKAQLAQSLESAADWRKLRAVVDKAEDVTDIAGKAMGVVGILKALAAGKAAFLIPGLALPAAAMAARKFVKDRGSQWLAKAANAMAKTESRLDDAALAVAEKARLPKNYGPAAEKAAVGVLGEPDWVGPLVEQATSDAAGNIPPPAKAAAQVGTYVERYKQLQEQTKELKDPKKRLDFISAATADIAAEQPELAAALQQQLMGDVDYLLATAPPGFTPRTIGVSPRQKPAVPYHDKRVLVDRAEALNDPDAVLEALARGELNLDQWDTLRARRPKRYEAMRSRVLEYAMDNPELPFKRRLAIGAAFQLPADWSDLHLSEIQLLNQPPAADQPAPPTAPLKDSSDMLATPSQKASL